MRLIEAAAQLIQSDIKLVAATKQTYTLQNSIPVDETGIDDLLPLSLHTFLNSLFVGKHKRVKMMAIGQAIMQAVRPKILIAPLQLGLAVQLHHHYGSRYLIDTLHALGFCSSYSEVTTFERSAALSSDDFLEGVTSEHTVQFVADNVDHDICTLDSRNTFHGMGMIAAVTPTIHQTKKPVPRCSLV